MPGNGVGTRRSEVSPKPSRPFAPLSHAKRAPSSSPTAKLYLWPPDAALLPSSAAPGPALPSPLPRPHHVVTVSGCQPPLCPCGCVMKGPPADTCCCTSGHLAKRGCCTSGPCTESVCPGAAGAPTRVQGVCHAFLPQHESNLHLMAREGWNCYGMGEEKSAGEFARRARVVVADYPPEPQAVSCSLRMQPQAVKCSPQRLAHVNGNVSSLHLICAPLCFEPDHRTLTTTTRPAGNGCCAPCGLGI